MKRGIKISLEILSLILLLSPFFSAEIIFAQPLKSTYNFGEQIYVPITIKTLSDVSGIFKMDLICNSTAINFYMNGIKLITGEEKNIDSSLLLIQEVIKGNKGNCRIKASLNDEFQISEEFKISDLLIPIIKIEKTEYNSGDIISITGKVERESGEDSDGFITAFLETSDLKQNLTQTGTINKGIISFNFLLPGNLKAGNYLLKLNAYEKDSEGIITNQGFSENNLSINQVPTKLELILENKELNPGSILRVKGILKDQTEEPIESKVYITIKNKEGKIIEQDEIETGIFLEYSILNNEPPAEWNIYASSKKLEANEKFKINAKESAFVEILNNTISITNDGNVFYNKTLLIKVGETPLNIQASLNIGETKKYVLTAPDGEYQVRVTTEGGGEIIRTLGLTGNAIGVGEKGIIDIKILSFILLGIALFLVLFFLIKKKKIRFHKRDKQSFKFKKKEEKSIPVMKEDSISPIINTAELSLSIKGNKQEASIMCLKIKNLDEITSNGSAASTLNKLKDIAEQNKAVIYDHQDYLLFMILPSNTKTFKNDVSLIELAEKIQSLLSEHNRMFNEKIKYGISLNKGELIGKNDGEVFKFMGMGSWMILSKKIASLSNEEIALSEKINDLVRVNIRSEKEVREGTPIYILKTIKKEDEEAKKFINKFMDRQKKENSNLQ